MTSKEFFQELITQIPNAAAGKMFGADAIKMPNGKAGAMCKDDKLLVKIPAEMAESKGFKVFSPKEGRPMNGWFEIPFSDREDWRRFAEISCAAVSQMEPNKKKKS